MPSWGSTIVLKKAMKMAGGATRSTRSRRGTRGTARARSAKVASGVFSSSMSGNAYQRPSRFSSPRT